MGAHLHNQGGLVALLRRTGAEWELLYHVAGGNTAHDVMRCTWKLMTPAAFSCPDQLGPSMLSPCTYAPLRVPAVL